MKIERMWIHFFSDIFAAVADPVICEYSRFSSLFAARDVSPGGTSAPQRQKFRTDDVKSVRNLVKSSDLVDGVVILFTNDWQKTKGHKGQT